MPENNTILFQQLFAGEQLYVIPEKTVQKDEVSVEKKLIVVPIAEQVVAEVKVEKVQEPLHFVPNHRVVILVDDCSDADQALLGKILTAVKLNLNQVDLVRLADLSRG